MKLYFLPGACSIGIHALLAEIGQPFEIEKAARPGTPEFEGFKRVNPNGKVPTLIRDDGSLLTEFPVIALYLARMHPEMELVPTDLEGEIRVLEMTEHLVSTVHMQGYTRLRRPEKFAPSASDHPAVQAFGLGIYVAVVIFVRSIYPTTLRGRQFTSSVPVVDFGVISQHFPGSAQFHASTDV